MAIYGYCRTYSDKEKKKQQEDKIKKLFPDAIIQTDKYSASTDNDTKWKKLQQSLKSGDTLIFDEIYRLSMTADNAFNDYMKLYDANINLVFIKQRHLDTSHYKEELHEKYDSKPIHDAINNYTIEMIRKQIKAAYDQVEQDEHLIHEKISDALKKTNKQIGRVKGRKYKSKKENKAKKIIQAESKSFNGSLTDKEVMQLAGISRNTYYKYKHDLLYPVIDSFKGDYHFLSNFEDSVITYGNLTYGSVESAYQAQKLDNDKDRLPYTFMDARKAKRKGKELPKPNDWHNRSLIIMEDLLRLKFSQPYFKEKLLDTGEAPLLEGNTWGDRFWGICDGEGENHLGKLLMKIRDEYRG